MRFIPVLLGAVIICCFAQPAAAEKYNLDKPHTQIIFSVNHLGFTNSYGKFTDYAGTLNFDEAQPEKSNVDVTIQTSSLNMDDEKWNEHLKSKDFFNVVQFPTMTFKSTKVEVTGDHTANVTGDLTLLGVTKPVTLVVTHNKTGKHPMKDIMASGFSATGTLKRSDFGMGYGVPMVGDEVKLIIEAEAYGEDKTVAGVENQ